MILPQQGLGADDIEYCAIQSTGQASDWVRGDSFCGTRGLPAPLAGFCLRLRDAALGRLECNYRATFVDGTSIGPLPAGTICKSLSGAPLEALQIDFQSIPQPAPSRDAGGAGEFAASNERFLRQAQAGLYDFLDLGTRDAGGSPSLASWAGAKDSASIPIPTP
jgi:hypothetical protein